MWCSILYIVHCTYYFTDGVSITDANTISEYFALDLGKEN